MEPDIPASDFNQNWNLTTTSSASLLVPNFTGISPVGAEFCANGHDEADVRGSLFYSIKESYF
jgi:hypothetical protein